MTLNAPHGVRFAMQKILGFEEPHFIAFAAHKL